MLKKSLICTLAIVILSLCCTICFAAEDGNKINLGNEIMKSIDKTENSMKNVVSGNVVNDAGNMVRNGINSVENGVERIGNDTMNVGNTVDGSIDNVGNIDNNNDRDNNGNDNNDNAVTGMNNGNYNTTRTSVDQTLNGGINTMTATTWMWIILIVAAVTIMAAIWYYATQSNK